MSTARQLRAELVRLRGIVSPYRTPPRAAIEATPYPNADGTQPDSGPSVADYIAQGLDPESAWLARYGADDSC